MTSRKSLRTRLCSINTRWIFRFGSERTRVVNNP